MTELKERALVLVIEDDPELNRFISENLADQYRIASAFDETDGLQKARDLKPDLILVESGPLGTGDSLVRALSPYSELDATSVVLIRAKEDVEEAARLLRGGVQDFLTKPFSVAELRARVANLIEKKLADAAVQEDEARLLGITTSSDDAIISIDEAHRIVTYNEGAEGIFGWSSEDVIGKPMDLLLAPGTRETHRQHINSLAVGTVNARRMSAGPAIVGLRRSGEEFPAREAISRAMTSRGWLFTVILRDVTERERIEKQEKILAEVGAILPTSLDFEETIAIIARVAAHNLGDWCVVDLVEEDGQLRRVAVASRDPAQAATAEAIKQIPLDPKRPYLSRAILQSGRPQVMSEISAETIQSVAQSEEHRRLIEAIAPTSAIGVPLIAHGRLLGALVVTSCCPERHYSSADIPLLEAFGKRVALTLVNARLNREVQRALQARENLLAIVAHDLRNPLGAILMQAERLRRHGPEQERRSTKPVAAIQRAAARMNRLIQDLLDVTRIEAGRLSLEPARVSAAQVIADSLDAELALASSASLELRPDVARNLPEVWADRDRLLQVFENLIDNAVRFTEAGGRITVGASPRDGDVLFSVADTGAGIAAEDVSHLFDRFWQAPKTGSRGIGLGLPIVKGIVEAHRGHVWVESVPGRGSTFFFTIPTAGYAEEASHGNGSDVCISR